MPTVAALVGVGLVATAAVGIVTLTPAFDLMPETSYLEVEGASRITTTSGEALLTTTLATSRLPPSSTSLPLASRPSSSVMTDLDSVPALGGGSGGAQHWSADLDPELVAWDGVFAIDDDSPARLADFMVVNEAVFTSAAAIAGRAELGLVVDGQWITASPILIDSSNDVAMLFVSDEDLGYLLTESSSVWSVAEDYQPPAPGTKISITNLSLAQSTAAAGKVLAHEERAMISTGEPVYGSVVTNAHRPEGSSGGAMVDQDGNLVGLIVDSDDYLTAAIPVDRLLSIKDSFEQWGVAANEWIGIEGTFRITSGAILTGVSEHGPADEAGLQEGDIITAIDGTALIDWAHLVHLIRQSDTGASIEISIDRHGYESTKDATVGSLADRPESSTALAPAETVDTDDD